MITHEGEDRQPGDGDLEKEIADALKPGNRFKRTKGIGQEALAGYAEAEGDLAEVLPISDMVSEGGPVRPDPDDGPPAGRAA